MICLVVFVGNMVRLSLIKIVEQSVQRAVIASILILNLACPYHLHYHGEVLLLLRSFILQIEHQRKKKHLSGGIPERVRT